MKQSPLHEFNLAHGGRLVDFGGWEMPVQYQSVLAEHQAVRSSSGFFDVSHLGRFELRGSGARGALDRLLCNNLERIEPGRAQYTMMLNQNGGVVDDIIVWWWDPGHFWIMPNAVNQPRVMEAFDAEPECEVSDLQMSTAMIAVQGPDSAGVFEELFGSAPGRFRTRVAEWQGAEVHMAGTGYTGERGGELVADPATALGLARALVDLGVTACGLGSRDTLRLEAGFPLWGQELDETTTPLEAGLEFAVDFDHHFVGTETLQHQRDSGLDRLLVGFILEERGVPRHGFAIRSGASSGEVTSGNMSPTIETGIGMAYLSPPIESGSVEVEIRGRWVRGRIEKPPFHKD